MLRQIEAAQSKPVTLAQLKAHARVDHDDDDDQIEIFLDAAIEFVAVRTGLTLAPSSWQIDRCDWWSGCLAVLLTPVRDVVITYLDTSGDTQTVAEGLYRWHRTPDQRGAEIRFFAEFTSPAVMADTYNAVQIAIEAGFDNPAATGAGDDPELALPARVQQIIMMIAAYWYDNREAAAEATLQKIPLAADALLFQLRVYR